jgi:preprotein translocase subunit SecA
VLENRADSLLAEQGQIAQSLDTTLARLPGDLDDSKLADLLMGMSVGTRLAIDPRTHQRVMKRVILLNYIFKAARFVQDEPVAEITDAILEHLESVRDSLEVVWGRIEYDRFRLSGNKLEDTNQSFQDELTSEFGETEFNAVAGQSLDLLNEEQKRSIELSLGRKTQNQIYRHILLSVISELWVEYLTRMDALRVSIGLEAFAQRDPLVQYKGQAAELFKALLSDIRTGVISRMFLTQPRRAGSQSTEKTPVIHAQAQSTSVIQPSTKPEQVDVSGKKRRKRH